MKTQTQQMKLAHEIWSPGSQSVAVGTNAVPWGFPECLGVEPVLGVHDRLPHNPLLKLKWKSESAKSR